MSLIESPTTSNLWAEESYDIVKHDVYEGIREVSSTHDLSDSQAPVNPNKEYLARSLKISEFQIVKGGYRLARVINDIWGTSKYMPTAIQDSQVEEPKNIVGPLTSQTFLQ